MNDKKLDLNSIIGFILIFGILVWIIYNNQPTQQEIAAEQAKKEQVIQQEKAEANKNAEVSNVVAANDSTATDTLKIAKLKSTLGNFAYSATLPSAKNDITTLENEVLLLKIANKGGYIVEATLKNYTRFTKNSGELVSLIKDNNAHLNIQLETKSNGILNTKNLYFEPSLTNVSGNQILTMRLKAGPNQFLEYKYVLKPNNYMVDFEVQSQGLNKELNTSKPLDMQWDLKSYRNEKSVSYENRYAEIYYEHKDGKVSYAGLGKHDEETPENLTFVAFKQHFFTSILVADKPFATSKLESFNLVHDEDVDTIFTKQFKANLPLAFNNGEVDYKMNWYFGPTDYKTLKGYDENLQKIVPLGWGIFGWINMLIFIPVFGFISNYLSLGIAIIVFTILIKLAMAPVTYKSFLSQAKMKVLRPEITELGEKYKKDPMKKQQETMKLYNKAGVNPMAGCIPALIQMPFLYAAFSFFPSAMQLRQKGFLWADDLSSFDAVVQLPFTIPFYGNHISLFPILAAIAIFFYMKMTTGDQQMAAPQQEGMPDMAKMMKIMIYISPVMMLIFFNSYGAGLSLYYFVSNLVTILVMIVIKKYIVDPEKIHAQIQENKLKEPKKQGKFQRKLQEVMEKAEEQKALDKANKTRRK